MTTEETVFEKTYQFYLEQLSKVQLVEVAPVLGGVFRDNALYLPFFNESYAVSQQGIVGPSGQKPRHDVCVIISRYLLMCPKKVPENANWVSFRDFKDSSPLSGYFSKSVEGFICDRFTGRLSALKSASSHLGGYPASIEARYDFIAQFDALPRIPVAVLYNDADDEFPSQCTLLFTARTETFLDAECIAMLGSQLASRLGRFAQ